MLSQRVIFYIDGFNLYHGIRDAGRRDCYWIDLPAMAERFLKAGQKLCCIKYFTARVSGPPDKLARQTAWLEAIGTYSLVALFEGHFMSKPRKCPNCRHVTRTFEEKMSDSAMATQLSFDACRDRFDVAFILAADADIVPPIEAIKNVFPAKKIIALFPPNRRSDHVRQTAHTTLKLWPNTLSSCQMPPTITRSDGHVITRPPKWA